MSALLTESEFEAIASSIDLPSNAFINGKFMSAKSGKTIPSVNPATGTVITEVAACQSEDIDYAVSKAREAFDRGYWSRMHPTERKHAMIKLVKLMKRHRHELAVLESIDSGKPILDCVEIDIPESLHCLEWHAEAADKLYDKISPSGDDALGMIVREPIGVVGCVLPWNFPLMMAAWKLGPALASGNSVIIKPAPQTSLTVLKLAELSIEAGIPPGVLTVVPGDGPEAGEALGMHPDVNAISFTGSTVIGRRFLEYSARSNLKRIVLELGGKNPCVVLDDAENLDYVAEHVAQAVFWNMGQNCSSNSRLIVQKGIKNQLLEKVIEKAADWRTGYPLDPANRLGAMNTKEHFNKVMGYIDIGKKDGASIVLGGQSLEIGDGIYIEPTIFDGVSREMRIGREEIFGPVLSVIEVDSPTEAISIANDTDYGLQASLFTSNVKQAHRMARDLQAGTVTVNCYGEGDISTPFGGYKQSG
ncbi:MAG: aldehyde dehydrogenase, partial [Woeseia sp.]|nr:aldehyde dehydrogenase [Woeseia sp.]